MEPELDAGCPRRWTTEAVDPRRALAYWVDTVCDRFLELDIDAPMRERFRAHLDQAELGAATMNVIGADRQRVRRTHAKIARSRFPVFCLLQLRSGTVQLRQFGREACLRAGESTLVDGTAPYELECPEATVSLALRMPEPWLKGWIAYPECLRGRVFGAGGWSTALNAALSSLAIGSLGCLVLPGGVVLEQIASLLALAAGRDTPCGERRSSLGELLAILAERMHEPDLSPLSVAAQQRISRRSLYYAFARAGTSFTRELMRLRLERARQVLDDPRAAGVPISEIAARCGFADPSHFARCYRQRFARSPSEARGAAVPTRH